MRQENGKYNHEIFLVAYTNRVIFKGCEILEKPLVPRDQKNIYTPNLGFAIAVFDREWEQGRFRGSTEGAPSEQGGAGGSKRERFGAMQGRSR